MTTLERLHIDYEWITQAIRMNANAGTMVISMRSAIALQRSMAASIAELQGTVEGSPTSTVEHPGASQTTDPQTAAFTAVRDEAVARMEAANEAVKAITVGLNPTVPPVVPVS